MHRLFPMALALCLPSVAFAQTPIPAVRFIDSLGVVMRIDQCAAHYCDTNADLADLKYLGIHNARNGIWGPKATYLTLAHQGIRHDLAGGAGDLNTFKGFITNTVQPMLAEVPGSVRAIEGPNEVNNFPYTYAGLSGVAAAVQFQKDIYPLVHNNPALAGVSVFWFTGWGLPPQFPNGPDPASGGLADYNNQHPYPRGGSAPGPTVARNAVYYNAPQGKGPGVFTEAGFSDTGSMGGNLGRTNIARYMLDMLMDNTQNGIFITYIYEMMDPNTQDGFGLFDINNTAKPVATAIHNLTTILADTAMPATGVVAAGPSSNAQNITLLKSNGETDFIVWAEPALSGDNPPPVTPVSVALNGTFPLVRVYDPMTGTSPIQTLANVSSVTLSLGASPLIVALPSGGNTPPVQPPVTKPTSATLVSVALSEDPYQGDAEFTLSVDGKAVTAPMAVTALHSTGTWQTVTVSTPMASGTHQVAVNFLNDAYGGSGATDRNLYVNGITVGGTHYGSGETSLMSNGPANFTVTVP